MYTYVHVQASPIFSGEQIFVSIPYAEEERGEVCISYAPLICNSPIQSWLKTISVDDPLPAFTNLVSNS